MTDPRETCPKNTSPLGQPGPRETLKTALTDEVLLKVWDEATAGSWTGKTAQGVAQRAAEAIRGILLAALLPHWPTTPEPPVAAPTCTPLGHFFPTGHHICVCRDAQTATMTTRLERACDHKFLGNEHCIKCGWNPFPIQPPR